jgi:hypothetical protein
MKTIDVAQVIHTLANVGVIGGLVFLGLEIRQNTNIAQATAYRENTQDIATWRSLILSDRELTRLYVAYTEDGIASLDELDRTRAAMLVNNVLGSYENTYFARNYGIVGDVEWTRFQSAACTHFRLARKNGLRLPFLTSEFKEYLTESCSTE